MPRTPRTQARRSSNGGAGQQQTPEPRMVQLEDEKDHKRVTASQHSQLVSEKLDRLRGLVKKIEEDNWMYEPKERVPNHVTKSKAWKPALQE